MSICKLCLEDKKLVDSHILPEFLYSPLYDEEHRFSFLSMREGKVIKQLKKGVYEKLLCEECDNIIIGQYENHAAKILFGDGKKEIEIVRTNYGHLIKGADYKLFKLFQISLLWRVSISTRPEIKKINLGPHQENMRLMLLDGLPGEVYEYGVWILLFPKSSKDLKDFILIPQPLTRKIQGHRCFRAIFNCLCWLFFVSSHVQLFSHLGFFLSKTGELPIVNSGEIGENFVRYLAKEYQQNRNEDA